MKPVRDLHSLARATSDISRDFSLIDQNFSLFLVSPSEIVACASSDEKSQLQPHYSNPKSKIKNQKFHGIAFSLAMSPLGPQSCWMKPLGKTDAMKSILCLAVVIGASICVGVAAEYRRSAVIVEK